LNRKDLNKQKQQEKRENIKFYISIATFILSLLTFLFKGG